MIRGKNQYGHVPFTIKEVLIIVSKLNTVLRLILLPLTGS